MASDQLLPDSEAVPGSTYSMQTSSILQKASTALAFLYVCTGFGLFLSVADNYLGKAGLLPLPPTVLALGFMLSIVGCAMVKDFLSGKPTEGLGMVLRSNTAVIYPFAFLAFTSLVFALHPTAYWGEDRKWIYLQSYDFLIFLTAMLIPGLVFIRRSYRLFVIIGLLTVLGSIWYEVENPSTFSSVPSRAAGFPGNSNWGALITVMICSMSLGYRDGPSRLLDVVLIAITGLGLYFTLSRSGTINFSFLICFYCWSALQSSRNRLQTGLAIGLALVCLLSFFFLVVPLISQSSTLMSGGTKAENRLTSLFGGEVVDDGSADDRLEAARETLDKIEQSPVFGHGTGFNRRMRQTPHNLYLKLWVDEGMFGLIAWISLLIGGFWLFSARDYRPGQALILVTAFGGFFSHNILEQRTFLILLGTGAAMSLFHAAKGVQQEQRLRWAVDRLNTGQNTDP